MRIRKGDCIDNTITINFTFDGKPYKGLLGDTLASALLANGINLIGRSLKYHRPRGIFSAGFEEPNALVQLVSKEISEPNVLATRVQIYDGMIAKSLNNWPSLTYDLFSFLGLLKRFIPAGFYYKTFFYSSYLWQKFYEPLLRRLAGFGHSPLSRDTKEYDTQYLNCDVLIIGGGISGISAARVLSDSNLKVILIEDKNSLYKSGKDKNIFNFLESMQNYIKDQIKIYNNTTVFGSYDDNYFAAIQKFSDLNRKATEAMISERILLIRAKKVVYATGSIERPLVFPNNDRPGIFLSNAGKIYLEKYGVSIGNNIIVYTNNDYAYETAFYIKHCANVSVRIVDIRKKISEDLVLEAEKNNIPLYLGYYIFDTYGKFKINKVLVGESKNKTLKFNCDALLLSGGWSPAIHLYSQRGGKVEYNNKIAGYVAVNQNIDQICVGDLCGTLSASQAIKSSFAAAGKILTPSNSESISHLIKSIPSDKENELGEFASVQFSPDEESKCFIDFQNDSTLSDLKLAIREGFVNPEHIKRYTLTGFGTDQGKIGNINALAHISKITNVPIHSFVPTTFRSPFLPVSFGALAGREKGNLYDPVRITSLNSCHQDLNAEFEDVGQWKRPWYYPRQGETFSETVYRECMAVRNSVGLLDASTLGKIEIVGKDVAEFLNRIYTNAWSKLSIGKVRYGLMCREDGMVFDDGTTARLSNNHYLMTTTTGNAALVLDWLEEWLQTEWTDLDVYCTSVTDHWATIAVAGPRSRDVLNKLIPDINIDNANFPFMSFKETEIAGILARIFRISFTGELSFEINVPWIDAEYIWKLLLEAGQDFNITPYGTEAMHVLRAEKGFPIIGQDTDGTVTPIDLGFQTLVSKKKDFLGKRSLFRKDTSDSNRKQFVGLKVLDGKTVVAEGSQIVSKRKSAGYIKRNENSFIIEGHVTSSYFSPILNCPIALALIRGGFERKGEIVFAMADGTSTDVEIVDSVFYDPDGEKHNG